MSKRTFPLSKVYGVLESGPVVLMTTSSHDRPNLMTMSWHTMLEFEPPQIAMVISNRDYSYAALKSTGECVINLPSADLIDQVVICGNTTGAKIDKWAKTGLTPIAAEQVSAPLIKECFINLECKVIDKSMVNKYGLFVVEVVKAWKNTAIKNPKTLHHLGKGLFMVAGELIQTKSKMR